MSTTEPNEYQAGENRAVDTRREVAALAGLLRETALHHGAFEKAAPAHDWWDWYAPYLSAREHGSTPEQATEAADRYMADVKHVVASRA
jgi:hypothetical protein